MLIIISVIVVFGFSYKNELTICETKQSPFCYQIKCPCQTDDDTPCGGYAKMPGDNPGQWYCSNAPNTLVDDNGKII
jgi:hypothetical protein